MSPLPNEVDVLVCGGGNAGFSSAISAIENGAKRVLIIDKCPEDWAGGNSFFTAGAFRAVHNGLEDILPFVNNVDDGLANLIDLDPYTREDFMADLLRLTDGKAEAELARALVDDSNDAVKWLAEHGVRFQLSLNRQAYKVDGRYKFWGGMCLKTEDGGKGLIEDYQKIAKRLGIDVIYSTPIKKLMRDRHTSAVTSVQVEHDGWEYTVMAKAVVLAAGGFEANQRMRSEHLGPGWDLAFVRGTPFNTGDGLEIAIRDVSAKRTGDWSGCHSVAWDANAPRHSGNRKVSNEFTKSGYPLGLMLNVEGDRFVDEGVDFRNFTYAKFGRAILQQPGGVAFQIWDSRGSLWLRDEEYRDSVVQKIKASSIEELAEKCSERGLQNSGRFIETIAGYNEAARLHRNEYPDLKWDPAIKDGLSTQSRDHGLAIPKSNWALTVDQPPFVAVKVGCGITFTFGGLAAESQTAGVISTSTEETIPGLFCAGEMLGGLFHGNYPGGSGLTAGAVFGRRAGAAAARSL